MRVGVDIGGSCVKAAIGTATRWVRLGQSGVYNRPGLAELRQAIGEAVGEVRDVASVGLCVPGVVERQTGMVRVSVNVPSLVGESLEEMVGEVLGVRAKVVICSDAVATARDIYDSRGLTGRLLVLALGTGVGCGVIDGGVALDVDEGSPGHFGQLDVSIAGQAVVGPDGGAGGLEGYIGGPALERTYGGMAGESVGRFNGDEPAILALVRALRIAHAIYRPMHVCLCGGIGLGLQHLLPVIRQRVEAQLTSLARAGWTLSCGEDVYHGARGAARISDEG